MYSFLDDIDRSKDLLLVMKRSQPLVALALNQLIDGGEFSRIFPIFVAGAIFAILSQQYICGKSGSTVLQALRILAEGVAGRLQITHLQLPESESLIFCVIVMLNIVLALQASRLHTSCCRERIVAVFVLSNGRFPLPSPFSSDFYLHCHPLPSSP